MTFGNLYGNRNPLERSLNDLQDKKPVMFGEDKDTFEKDGRFFIMNREVPKAEYDAFMTTYQAALDLEIAEKKAQLAETEEFVS